MRNVLKTAVVTILIAVTTLIAGQPAQAATRVPDGQTFIAGYVGEHYGVTPTAKMNKTKMSFISSGLCDSAGYWASAPMRGVGSSVYVTGQNGCTSVQIYNGVYDRGPVEQSLTYYCMAGKTVNFPEGNRFNDGGGISIRFFHSYMYFGPGC